MYVITKYTDQSKRIIGTCDKIEDAKSPIISTFEKAYRKLHKEAKFRWKLDDHIFRVEINTGGKWRDEPTLWIFKEVEHYMGKK